MRVALVGPSWPFRGGIARTTTALAAALAGRGSLAAFLVPSRQYPRLLYPGGADADPAACPRLAAAAACFAVLEPWSWPALRARLRAARPDAVAVPYWTWAWAPLARRVAAWRVAPLIGIVHNPADHDASAAARLAARAVLGRCDGFLCHAASVAAALEEQRGGRPLAVHPLPPDPPPPVDRDRARAALAVPHDAVALLCFGLIRPYKGVDVLLDALASLPGSSPAFLLLAGEPWGELTEQLRRRLADPRLAGRVHAHLGWVPEQRAADYFAAADAAVLPYRAATGSAVAAQALGAGLPIVASAVGGLVDVVEEGVNGLLVPPADAHALAAALARICEPETRRWLAEGARRRSWSWDSYAATLEHLARQLPRR